MLCRQLDMISMELSSNISHPRPEDVAEVMKRFQAVQQSGNTFLDPIYDLEDGRCVKVGTRRLWEEASYMEYVRKNTSIPVPRVHMVINGTGEWTYLVMDFIHGKTLQMAYLYKQLTGGDIERIADQLMDYIHQIRTLPIPSLSPPTAIGTYNGGPCRCVYFHKYPWNPQSVVPLSAFPDTIEFNKYWFNRGKIPYPENILGEAEFQLQYRDSVLAHGDLNTTNIIVDEGRIIGVIDWECFGWWPEFWEGLRIWEGSSGQPLWRQEILKRLNPPLRLYEVYESCFLNAFDEPLHY